VVAKATAKRTARARKKRASPAAKRKDTFHAYKDLLNASTAAVQK
jgi:hypothetical protein